MENEIQFEEFLGLLDISWIVLLAYALGSGEPEESRDSAARILRRKIIERSGYDLSRESPLKALLGEEPGDSAESEGFRKIIEPLLEEELESGLEHISGLIAQIRAAREGFEPGGEP